MSSEGRAASGLIEALNRFFRVVAGFCFDFRWGVLAASLAFAVGAGMVAEGVGFDASYEHYFYPGDTTYQSYEQYRDDFGSDEVAYVGYEVAGLEHGPWNVVAMERLVQLTEALEDEVPFIYEVTTLANAELTVGDEDGIEITKIIDDWPLTQAELLELREAYLKKPMLVGGIIDEDADFGALILEMDRSSTDPPDEILAPPEQQPFPDDPGNYENLYPQVTDAKIFEILARPEYDDYEFWASGDVPINAYFNRIIFVEPDFLMQIAMFVIAIILCLTFRERSSIARQFGFAALYAGGTLGALYGVSLLEAPALAGFALTLPLAMLVVAWSLAIACKAFISVTAPLVVVQLSVIATVAFMALVGWDISLGFSGTPTLLTAIGVAHSVHVLSEFKTNLAEGRARRTALVETMGLVGMPCLLTSVTTAVGFASMSFVPIKSLAQGGVTDAVGVLLTFVFSMTLLMSLLSIDWLEGFRWIAAKVRGREATSEPVVGAVDASAKGGDWIKSALDSVASLNIAHTNRLLAIFAVFLVTCLIGATRIEVDSNYLKDFWPTSWMYVNTVKVDTEMGGTTNVVYLFDAGEDDAIKEPAVLREIDRLQQSANQEDWLVTKTYSIVDIVKDLNQAFHGDDPAYYAIPETREEVAQYLLLYESSGGEEAEEYVTSDYRRANVELRLKMDRTAAMQELIRGLDAELEDPPLEETTVSLTGIGALWLILMDYIVSSQIQGLTLAFSVITLFMVLLFRSFKIGLISMVPNLAPVLLALGAMGWSGISLDYNKATIAAIALGISVDDTIHLMTRFHHEFGIHQNYRKALREALGDVGRALVITSIALVLGFLAMSFSELRSQAFYGLLLASALVTALIADFFFMPALVLRFEPFGPEGQGAGSARTEELREAA
ncbi:MAG: MMPL family transporter [bacterium]|nr:MMPL family transporter [bacterium]